LLHLHCGTASQIISGLKIASPNSRVFCSPGMGPNVAVLPVDPSLDMEDDDDFAYIPLKNIPPQGCNGLTIMTQNRENFILIRHIIKQYNISSKELFTEYTLTIKQHKSHAKLQTKIS
jgi:hypothetical protein